MTGEVSHVVDLVNIREITFIWVISQLEDLATRWAHVLEVAFHREPAQWVRVVNSTNTTNSTIWLWGEDHGWFFHSTWWANQTLGDWELCVFIEDVVLESSWAKVVLEWRSRIKVLRSGDIVME